MSNLTALGNAALESSAIAGDESAARELIRRLHKSRQTRSQNHPQTLRLVEHLQRVRAAVAAQREACPEAPIMEDPSVSREADSQPETFEPVTVVINGREVTLAPKPPKAPKAKKTREARDHEAGEMYLLRMSGVSTKEIAEKFGKSGPQVVSAAISRFVKRHGVPSPKTHVMEG